MINAGRLKKNAPLFLIAGVLILCIGFFIVSCGTKPQQKVETITGGAYAVDFSDCPAIAIGPCRAVVESTVFKKDPNKSMALPSGEFKELTAEAWVKIHSTSTSGVIFTRMDSGGITLYVESGTPKAAVRRMTGVPPATSTVDMIVGSGASDLILEAWTHIAAVLSFPDSSSSRLDLYVDGALADTQNVDENGDTVARTEFSEAASNGMWAGSFLDGVSVSITGISRTAELDGAVDEARLWGVARTQSEIQACMGQELDLDGSMCGRVTGDLIGYFRFNEGSGHTVNEWSGLGSGAKEYNDPTSSNDPPVESWNSGWVGGAPISPKD